MLILWGENFQLEGMANAEMYKSIACDVGKCRNATVACID